MEQTKTVKVREEIVRANTKFMGYFRNGDSKGLADCYTVDAKVLPPNLDEVSGREAIAQFWQALMDSGIKEAKLMTGEVDGNSTTAVEVSKYSLHDINGETLDSGKYIVVWKEEEGRWKLHRDIFNSSVPTK